MTRAQCEPREGTVGCGAGTYGAVKAPVPYPGGKGHVAAHVWRRLGVGANAPKHVIIPFAGMLGVLRGRPDWRPSVRLVETVNDADGLLVNALRAMALRESEVIDALMLDVAGERTMWPPSEVDQRARALWLIDHRDRIRDGLVDDPEWCDPRAAAWWLWGASSWIGGGWPADVAQAPDLVARHGRGAQACDGAERVRRMADRLRYVRTLCGDWRRCVSSRSVLGLAGAHGLSPTAVYLEPDYGEGMTYPGSDGRDLMGEVWAWAVEAGACGRVRIALSGYAQPDDLAGALGPDGTPLPAGWSALRWSTQARERGAGRATSAAARARADRECIWFSPGCLSARQATQVPLL